ncbi:MAG: pyridoxal phosphate-dependent aminotransferase [Candidatus Methylomirabilis sp.]
MDFGDRFVAARIRVAPPRDSGADERDRLQAIARDLQGVIHLNSSNPELPAAPAAVEAAVEALQAGRTALIPEGLPELRAAIAKKLSTDNGFAVDPQVQIVVTNGGAAAASVLFHTLVESGNEVLTTDPFYPGHVTAIAAAGGIPVLVPTRGEDLWEPNLEEVERRITPRTRAFIFASPGNPTAAVYRRETLEGLLAIAHRRNILMIADEVFDRFAYDGRRHISVASLPDAGDRVVTINGFSKSYCMPGWRIGWIAAPRWLAGPVAEARHALAVTTTTHGQWGAIAALSEAARTYYDVVYRIFGERRAFFFDALARLGIPQRPAPGGVVGMIDIRLTGRTSAEVAEILLQQARVFLWPGTAFGSQGEGWLRIGLTQPMETLSEAIRRLEPVVASLLISLPRHRPIP